MLKDIFFTPIPCTYSSSLLDGMARNCYYYFIYMDSQDHAIDHVWIHFIPTSLYPRREKIIWSELESNPGPLASQATLLTTRQLLLGQFAQRFHKWTFFAKLQYLAWLCKTSDASFSQHQIFSLASFALLHKVANICFSPKPHILSRSGSSSWSSLP